MKLKPLYLSLLLLTVIVGCKKDPIVERVPCDGSTPTWNTEVIDIVANSCWGSSCHGSGAQSGDYTTYAGIRPVLLNGRFEQQVLVSKAMPQGEIFPDSILSKLQCWLETGFPES